MRVKELLKLTWPKVDEKAGLIRLKAADVKENAPRLVPISPALQAVLDELKQEQKQGVQWASAWKSSDGSASG